MKNSTALFRYPRIQVCLLWTKRPIYTVEQIVEITRIKSQTLLWNLRACYRKPSCLSCLRRWTGRQARYLLSVVLEA